MTEEEARKKICCGPFQDATYTDWIKCRASECMAWRWNCDLYADDVDGLAVDPKLGYCGLAGRP